MKNELEQAKELALNYQPNEARGDGYVYIFTGRIESYSLLFKTNAEGQLMQSDWIFKVDLTQNSCICYVGEGTGNRVYIDTDRKLVVDKNQRIILRDGLSLKDRKQLESLLVKHFGLIVDPVNAGTLANLQYEPDSSSGLYRIKTSFYIDSCKNPNSEIGKARKRAAESRSKPIVVCDVDKNVIAIGSATELAKRLQVTQPSVTQTAQGRNGRRTIGSRLYNQRLYVCYQEQFETFTPIQGRRRRVDIQLQRYLAIRHKDKERYIGTAADLAGIINVTANAIHTAGNPDYPHVKTVKGFQITILSNQ